MSLLESQSSEDQPRTPSRRPTEIDAYVDSFLSLVCDKSRRYILELLTAPQGDQVEDEVPERRSGDIARAIGLSPAATSEHLRQLVDADLLASRRDGTGVYYRVKNGKLVQVFQGLVDALDQNYVSQSDQQK
jgi:DNA-binding transcriptional ArsR family regulator